MTSTCETKDNEEEVRIVVDSLQKEIGDLVKDIKESVKRGESEEVRIVVDSLQKEIGDLVNELTGLCFQLEVILAPQTYEASEEPPCERVCSLAVDMEFMLVSLRESVERVRGIRRSLRL